LLLKVSSGWASELARRRAGVSPTGEWGRESLSNQKAADESFAAASRFNLPEMLNLVKRWAVASFALVQKVALKSVMRAMDEFGPTLTDE
jgi:hypothetical protein